MEKASIIIPCYNDAEFIEQAIDSAMGQTYANKEVIVVDDGSNQETKAILEKWKPKVDLLITQENKGQSNARNMGILAANGLYIIVLDSDDFFDPSFCEKAVVAIQKRSEAKLITCHASCHFSNNRADIYKPTGGDLNNFLFSNNAIGNALFKKEDWKLAGGYDECMREGWEDWEFYIRLMALGGTCIVIPKVLFNYRKRDNSTTARANQNKYRLYDYIFNKHLDLYKEHCGDLIQFLLRKLEQEEREKDKNRARIDFRLGKAILAPIRFLKGKFSKITVF